MRRKKSRSSALWWVVNGRAARLILQDRRLDLQEATVEEEASHRADDLRPLRRDDHRSLVGEEVEVALAGTRLGVLQPRPLVGERQQGLRDDSPGGDGHGDLARARAEERAADLQEVAEVDERERLEGVEVVAPEVELDASGGVTDVEEGGLSHHPLGGDAADHGDLDGALGLAGVDEGGDGLRRGVRARDARRVGVARLQETSALVEALLEEFALRWHMGSNAYAGGRRTRGQAPQRRRRNPACETRPPEIWNCGRVLPWRDPV